MAATSSGGTRDIIPVWGEKPSTLEDFEEVLKYYKSAAKKDDRYLCASRVI